MLEIVLDRFSHVSHGRVVGTTEHFARVSSRIEPARLLRFTRTCGILDFPVFEKKSEFRSITSPSAKFCQFVSQLIKSREIVMPPSLFDRLPEELITKILDMIFEESDDYPEGAHYFLEYQIFKRDPENYHGCFEIEFLV